MKKTKHRKLLTNKRSSKQTNQISRHSVKSDPILLSLPVLAFTSPTKPRSRTICPKLSRPVRPFLPLLRQPDHRCHLHGLPHPLAVLVRVVFVRSAATRAARAARAVLAVSLGLVLIADRQICRVTLGLPMPPTRTMALSAIPSNIRRRRGLTLVRFTPTRKYLWGGAESHWNGMTAGGTWTFMTRTAAARVG